MAARQSAYRRSYGPDRRYKASSPTPVNITPEMRKMREAEKTKLKKCNNRLVVYIEKVHDLEEANKLLAAQNALLRKSEKTPQTDVGELYEDELKKLREKIEDLTVEKAKLEIERDNLDYELNETFEKLEEEKEERKAAEKEVKDLRKDVDDATIERVGLESKTENLQETLELEKQAHAVELDNLRGQIQPVHATVVENEPSIMPDLSDAISDIRRQYEAFNTTNIETLDAFYKEKCATLNSNLKTVQGENKLLREESIELKKKIHELELQLQLQRPKIDKLNDKIQSLEEDYDKQNRDAQEKIAQMEKELDDTKQDLGAYLKNCQELSQLKLSLEQEIAIYNKLLSGEETRILDVEVADPKSVVRSKDKGEDRGRSRSRSRSRSKSRSRSRSKSSSSSRSMSDVVEELMENDKAKDEEKLNNKATSTPRSTIPSLPFSPTSTPSNPSSPDHDVLFNVDNSNEGLLEHVFPQIPFDEKISPREYCHSPISDVEFETKRTKQQEPPDKVSVRNQIVEKLFKQLTENDLDRTSAASAVIAAEQSRVSESQIENRLPCPQINEKMSAENLTDVAPLLSIDLDSSPENANCSFPLTSSPCFDPVPSPSLRRKKKSSPFSGKFTIKSPRGEEFIRVKKQGVISVTWKVKGGTVSAVDEFNSNDDAKRLRNALTGFGTDEKTVVEILGKRSKGQRLAISEAYKQIYNDNLLEDLKKELSGDFKTVVLHLMWGRSVMDANSLRKALKGFGTDEAVLIEILCTQGSSEIEAIKKAYAKEFPGKDLEKDIEKETSGAFKNFLLSVLKAKRPADSGTVVANLADADAEHLSKTKVKDWSPSDEKFLEIFTQRSFEHLWFLFNQSWPKVSSEDLLETIDAECKGDLKRGLTSLVRFSVYIPPVYYATQLYEGMKGFGTEDNQIIYIITTRCEIDMIDIKEEFNHKYGVDLATKIKSETKGDYRNMLLTLIGENQD